MKLLRCKVVAFGKLKNFEYEFTGGLNTIKQDNGWGKSTLATFVKAMFYGLDDGKRSVAENERTRFKPWNSTEAFGGSVEFKWGEGEYRIERFFGAKKSDDTVRLFDKKTGKQFDRTEDLGGRIFSIDEAGFLSTTFFSQKDFEVKSNTSLTAKFNEVNEIQDTAMFDKAVAKLDAKAKSYKYSGNRGIIPEIKDEIYSVNGEIERARRAGSEAEKIKETLGFYEKENARLSAYKEKLTERIGVAGKAEAAAIRRARYLKCAEEIRLLSERKRAADYVLNGNRVNLETISGLKGYAADLVKNGERERMIESDVKTLEEAEKNKFDGTKSKKIACFSAAGLATIIAIILLFALSGAAKWVFSVALFIVAAIFVACAVTVKPRKNDDSLYLKKKTELDEYRAMNAECARSLDNILAGYNADKSRGYAAAINEIENAYFLSKDLTEKINAATAEAETLKKEGADKIVETTTDNVDALNAELKAVQAEYDKNSRALADKRLYLRSYETESDSLCDLENKKAELADRLKQAEEQSDLVKTTLEFLKQADENLKVKYRAPLAESLNKYLSYIAGSVKADIDTDLKVSVEESGGNRETDYYSKGYRNLFEICKRFALTDVLFTDEKPFIVLDDPFYNLDDEKLKQSLSLIKKLSESYQIIYLVCHESRVAE